MHGAQHGFMRRSGSWTLSCSVAFLTKPKEPKRDSSSPSIPWKRNSALQADWRGTFGEWIRSTSVGQSPGARPVFAVAARKHAFEKLSDPLAGIDTLWHLRNLRFQWAGRHRARTLVAPPLFFSDNSLALPPSPAVLLHFSPSDFPPARFFGVAASFPLIGAGISKGSLKRPCTLAIYDPWFIRELVVVAVLVEGSLPILGVRRTRKWMSFFARLLPRFRFVALDYSSEQTALLHEQRASCSLLWKPTCLRRALTRCWALSRRVGDRSNLEIAFGMHTQSGQRAFHSWLERDRQPVGEFPPHVSSYAPPAEQIA